MRAAIDRNNPHIVDHVDNDRDRGWRLDDLIFVVVKTRQHRRTRRRPIETPFLQQSILAAIRGVLASIRDLCRHSFLRFGSQWRNAAIRRIDDQRRAQPWYYFGPTIPPELVVRVIDIGLWI